MNLRPATYADRRTLYQLATDPTMRLARGTDRIFTWAEHCQWVKKVLGAPNVHLFIAEDGNKIVGEIRFDVDGEQAEVGLVVNKRGRGQGYGTEMITEGMKLVPCEKYTARIDPDNVASRKCFRRAGFSRVGGEYSIHWIKSEAPDE